MLRSSMAWLCGATTRGEFWGDCDYLTNEPSCNGSSTNHLRFLAAITPNHQIEACPVKQTDSSSGLLQWLNFTRNCQPENRERSGRQATGGLIRQDNSFLSPVRSSLRSPVCVTSSP